MACNKFFNLGRGLRMPAFGLGTWQAPDHEVEQAIDQALEIGYRHFDCAPVYQNEKAIGRVLNKWLTSKKLAREDLFIVTKLPPTGNRASSVEMCLKKSLNDLQLSYIDLYLIHVPFAVPYVEGDFKRDENGEIILDKETKHVDTWHKMEEMVSSGLTKAIGVSNFNKNQIQRILDNCNIKPSVLQIELHIYFQQNELVDFCKQNGIVVTAYSPLGSKGIAELNKIVGVDRDLPDLMENPVVIKIAEKHNKTPAQILLRWIIQRDISTIPKSTNSRRLRENINIFDFSLDEDDMNELFKLDKGIRICDFAFFKGVEKHPEFPW